MIKDIHNGIETIEEKHKKFWNSWLSLENGRRLQRIRDYVQNKWKDKPDIKFFLSHNDAHNKKVEDNLHLLIPGYSFGALREEERFLLIAAAWLHDLGMIKGLKKGDEFISDELIRENHEKRSIEYIRDNFDEIGLSLGEVVALENIIKFHVSKSSINQCPENYIIGKNRIRLQLLAAYLRLADAIHIDESRIDTFLYRIYRSDMPVTSKFHWVLSNMVSGIFPNAEENCIEISLNVPEKWLKEDMHDPLVVLLREGLERELEMVKNPMVRGGITAYLDVMIKETPTTSIPPAVEEDMRKVIDSIQIMQYPNASRLIQGVLDSVLELCKDKEREEPKNILYEIKYYLEDKLKTDLQKRSTHLGAIKTATSLLDLTKNLNTSNKEGVNYASLLDNLEKKVNILLSERKDVFDNITKHAITLFKDDDNILVFGYSSTVLYILKHLHNKKKREIFVAECRNKALYARYGNNIVYNDGVVFSEEILNELEFAKVNLISDASVAHYMANGAITKILFGANGVLINKGILHSVGHLMIAAVACYYKIPVYVAAETLKFLESSEVEFNIDNERETSWLMEDFSWDNRLKNIKVKKPRNDIVPYELITAFITEKGIELINKSSTL